MIDAGACRGCRLPAEVILWAVRWSLQFPLSYRDLERMLADRGVEVDPVTLFRWAQRFAPELEKRTRRHLHPPSAEALGITRSSLRPLARKPHEEALRWRWRRLIGKN